MSELDDPAARVFRVSAVLGGILMLAVISVAVDNGFGAAAPSVDSDGTPTRSFFSFSFGRGGGEEAQHNPSPRTHEAGFKLIGWRKTDGGMSAVHLGVFPTEADCEAAKRRYGGDDISCARA